MKEEVKFGSLREAGDLNEDYKVNGRNDAYRNVMKVDDDVYQVVNNKEFGGVFSRTVSRIKHLST